MTTNDFGHALKALLDARALTIRKCSERTGIDKATISRIINGKRKANVQHLEKLSTCLNVPFTELMHAAGYLTEQKQQGKLSDMHSSLEDIQKILDASNHYEDNFSKEAVKLQLDNYEQYAGTPDGKQTIHKQFKEKLNQVGSIGPFINQLKDFHTQFVQHKGTPYELAIVGSVLLYFIVPVDVIPDYIFPIGYVDDAIAVQIGLKSLSN